MGTIGPIMDKVVVKHGEEFGCGLVGVQGFESRDFTPRGAAALVGCAYLECHQGIGSA